MTDKKEKARGGVRDGAGRKPTGRKKYNFYVTEDEYVKLKEFIEELRKPQE